MRILLFILALGSLAAGNALADKPMRFDAKLFGFNAGGAPVATNAQGGASVEVIDDGTAIGLGLANAGGGLLQAMPSGGGTSQTAVNDQAGAKTQVAEFVTAGIVVVTLLFLAPLVSLLPQAVLGALVLVAAAGLVKVSEFQEIARISKRELIWALVAFAGVVLLGTLEGILVAVGLSLLVLIYQANHPPVYEVGRKPGTDMYRATVDHPDDETVSGLLVLRTEGSLHFASSPRALEKTIRSPSGCHAGC